MTIMTLMGNEDSRHFDGASHALVTGMMLGLLSKEGWEARPIMDGSDYTNQIVIKHPDIDETFVVEVRTSKKAFEDLREGK